MDILHMSISAAVLIIVVVVLRALMLYKLPKKTFLILWCVVICRLVLPFSIPSRLSFYTGMDMLQQASKGTTCVDVQAVSDGLSNIINGTPVIDVTDFGSLTNSGTTSSFLYISPLILIWFIGMCACVIFFTVTYIKCRRDFGTALPVENDCITLWQKQNPIWLRVQIRQSDRIKAPLTYGIFHPVVLLPNKAEWMDETKLQYILTHEYVHIKRFDALTKLLLTAVLCIHWFNPFVWVMYILANRDIELSCDETVVKTFGETMRSDYALTLIGLEEKKRRLTPLCNNFSKNAIEERIIAIMKIKKYSIPIIVVTILLVVGVTVGFATSNAKASDNPNSQDNTNVLTSMPPTSDNTSVNVTETSEIPSTNSIDSSLSPVTSPDVNTAENNSGVTQDNYKAGELISNVHGIIISKRYYPITNEYLLTRYDSTTLETTVSFDDGTTWMFRRFDSGTNMAQYSLDGNTWGTAPVK